MISKSVCEQVLACALSRGGTFAEIFYEDSKNFSMRLRSGHIETAGVSRPRGAGIRIFPADYGALMMVLPVGGFLTLGCLIALVQWVQNRQKEGKK